MFPLIAIIQQLQQPADLLPGTAAPEWLVAALLAYQAGSLTRKQKRKLKWKLAWEVVKSKFSFRKAKKKTENKGVFILLLVICLGLTGLIFALGAVTWGIVAAIMTLLVAILLFGK